jgi:hypothetical protein
MLRRPGKSNLLRRLDCIEARITDQSRLAPHSPEWLAFWDRQVYNRMTDQEYVPLTVEALRAVMRYSDNPASMVGRIAGSE